MVQRKVLLAQKNIISRCAQEIFQLIFIIAMDLITGFNKDRYWDEKGAKKSRVLRHEGQGLGTRQNRSLRKLRFITFYRGMILLQLCIIIKLRKIAAFEAIFF